MRRFSFLFSGDLKFRRDIWGKSCQLNLRIMKKSKIENLLDELSTNDQLQKWIFENFEEESSRAVCQITDRIIPDVKAWQTRPLDPLYCILWLDAMHYKVKVDGKIQHKALYNILGINKEGYKEVLGMYISESEGANFWLQLLTDLQNRGLEDILIAFKGFTNAFSVFPKTQVHLCIVHQIRNSLKYIASKDHKEFMRDLKKVYRAVNKEVAEDKLLHLEEKWGQKYPVVIESWQRNWEELSQYFQFTEPIRKIIYTTNAVDVFHRQVRKVTKTKGAFTNGMSLLKLVYLATKNIEKKWTAHTDPSPLMDSKFLFFKLPQDPTTHLINLLPQ